MRFLNQLYGNSVVLRHMRGQREIPFLSAERKRDLQSIRIREIVAYAAATVPYYQKIFREAGIDPHKISQVEDLEKLPLLDKEIVRKDPSQFVSNSSRGKKAIPFLTSGTTGKPLEIFHDEKSLLANIAYSERERQVVSRLVGKTDSYKEIHIDYGTSTSRKVLEFYRNRTWIPTRPNRLLLSVSDPIPKIVESINRFRPDAILTFGSYLETFARILALRKMEIVPPKVFLYVGDGISKEARIEIEETLGAPVISRYNSVESFKLGYFCEKRIGFHVHEDLCPIRILKKDPNSEKGEVIISNLVNHGTVLLNYRLGDVASMQEISCSCGRTSPVIAALDGRVEDTIFLSNGEFVHPRTVWNVFKQREGLLQYQLIQQEPERFELKLVTEDRKTYEEIVQPILSELQALLGSSAVIEPAFYEEIKRVGETKFRSVMGLRRGL